MNQIEKISTHKQILGPSEDQKVPVVFHVSEKLMPDDFTINQLKTVASNKHVFKHVSALTDVHQKPGRRILLDQSSLLRSSSCHNFSTPPPIAECAS